ncbi:MAG: patatin [Roseivirga sp.]|nr:patatin [Roseivirga sp.]
MADNSTKKKVCILSIDGGGIRGVLPGVIVARLEEKLQIATGNQDARIADYFDLIAGTSTGGILSCFYLMPDPEDPTRSKFNAQQAVDLYLKRGGDIFDVSFMQKLRSGAGLLDEKYSANAIESALGDNFGDTWLSELRKPCLVTSYDMQNRNAFFFRQQRASNEINDFKVKDVARATSAAPTYFETSLVVNKIGSPYPLVDGGVFANNPTMCAYSEARSMNFEGKAEQPGAKDMMVVSIGTGSVRKPYAYERAKDWGLIQWIQPIIDVMMSGNSETVHYQINQIFDTVKEGNTSSYYRLEPQLGTANSEMDDASDKNLQALNAAGKAFVSLAENDRQLDDIVEILRANN